MQRLEQAHQDPHDEVGPGSSGHGLMRHCMRQCMSGDSIIGPRMMRHGSMRGPFAMRTPDHPLRDAKPANDGNLYPYNSKLRPPPLWIDEDSVEIADQPKVVSSDPHYWPYTEQRPPPFVPPQPQIDPPPGEDSACK
jgi:hypothetical protein